MAGSNQGTVAKKKAGDEMEALSKEQIAQLLDLSFDDIASSPEAIDSARAFAMPELTDKDDLVGQPFIILYWSFYPGDFGNEFAAVVVMNKANELLVFNEGGTGVSAQLRQYTEKHGTVRGPIVVRKGLTRSDYWRDPENGDVHRQKPEGVYTEPAKTYYLS